MKRLLQFTGLLTWIVAIGYGIIYLKRNSQEFNELLKTIGLITLIISFVYITFRVIWGDKWLIRYGKTFFIGDDLIQSFNKFFEELPQPSKETIASLAGHLIYRFTRLGIFGMLIALIPLILLWQQNKLLQIQNEKIDRQNELFNFQNNRVDEQTKLFAEQNQAVETQTGLLSSQDSLIKQQNVFVGKQTKLFGQQILQTSKQNMLLSKQNDLAQKQLEKTQIQIKLSEAERRSSLNFLLGSLLDQINDDLNNSQDSVLSNLTIGRIVGLSQSFKPYYYIDGDSLISRQISPERGQLLIALLKSDLSQETYSTIFSQATFLQAELTNTDLRKTFLSKIDLGGADLRRVDLNGVDLNNIDLRDANLEQIDLGRTNLSAANMLRVNLSNAFLGGANLYLAALEDANLTEAGLSNANLQGANLQRANFNRTTMYDANFKWVELQGAQNLTVNQLKTVNSLYKAEGIPEEIRKILLKEKPCLFTDEGCKK